MIFNILGGFQKNEYFLGVFRFCGSFLKVKVKKGFFFQGGQSRGQHDWVYGFPEPVKSFITFVILSQISCGKVQIPLIFFYKIVSKFLLGLL